MSFKDFYNYFLSTLLNLHFTCSFTLLFSSICYNLQRIIPPIIWPCLAVFILINTIILLFRIKVSSDDTIFIDERLIFIPLLIYISKSISYESISYYENTLNFSHTLRNCLSFIHFFTVFHKLYEITRKLFNKLAKLIN